MFAERLKQLRKFNKLTQKQLADHFKYSHVAVVKWENGTREPNFKTLKELASFFNVSVDYLLGLTDSIYTAEDYPVGMHSVTVNDRELQLLENYRLLSEYLQGITFDTIQHLTVVK